MATRISLIKNSTSTTEPEYCEAYTLNKQHKVYSKELPINKKDKLRVRIHTDLFDGGNTLPGVGGY